MTVLDSLKLGNYKVKLNHRCLLDALMELCGRYSAVPSVFSLLTLAHIYTGVPSDKFRTICSAVDKLDKESWTVVRQEMLEKGLDAAAADKLGEWVTLPPAAPGQPFELLEKLEKSSSPTFSSHSGAQRAFADLKLLFEYLKAMNCLDRFSLDLSLARGLDYYTGIIYEAVLTDQDRVGSIAAGGRYDSLIGMFSTEQIPAVGVSIGLERVLSIIEEQERARLGRLRKTGTHVMVGSVGKDMLKQRMALAAELWAHGVRAEFSYDSNPKPKKQLEHALESGIPLVCWIGEDELAKGVVSVKDLISNQQSELARGELAAFLRTRIAEIDATGAQVATLQQKP